MLKPPSLFYRLLSILLLFVWLIHAILHALKFKQFSYISQRLGFTTKTTDDALIWVHAASVGEVNLMYPLCQSLIDKKHRLLITTSSATGLQQVKKLFSASLQSQIIPIDFLPISKLFIARNNIKLALIAETELWPETLYQTAKNSIPILHINARLSKKSRQAPLLIRQTLKNTLQYFSHHFVRYPTDVNHFKSMAVKNDKITVMGNLKYVQTADKHEMPPNLVGQEYLLAASTREGEEQLITKLLHNNTHWPLLVIAPRHPKRAKQILMSLEPYQLNIAQRSKADKITSETQVYLADTLGEMAALFQHAHLVVMGGSFTDVGGHNLLEPIALGKATITGPSDFNIKQDVDELKQQHAIIQVFTKAELETRINQLLNNDIECKKLGNNGKNFIASKQMILQDYLEKINTYL
ncbi:MAG: glycosyltransferase [Gammaproteobacteria bacterium]|nr:glycosyltransferase [Gammaproteobacteria bacterium]